MKESCIDCGRMVSSGYRTDEHGKKLKGIRCSRCHEDHVRRGVTRADDHYMLFGGKRVVTCLNASKNRFQGG